MIHSQTDPASECPGQLRLLLSGEDVYSVRDALGLPRTRSRTIAVYVCESCELRLSLGRDDNWRAQTTELSFALLNSYRVPRLRHWESELAQSFVLAAAGEPASSNYDRSSMLPGPGRE